MVKKVLAGALHAMDLSKDKMITAYRNHVAAYWYGVDPRAVMAELLGKATGTSKGLGGSMHIFLKNMVLWRSWYCWCTNPCRCWYGICR